MALVTITRSLGCGESDIAQRVSTLQLESVFLLLNSIYPNHLFKRGLDRGYINLAEDTRCLKGKICFAPTLKQNLLSKAQVHCAFDDLNHNILHNQIIKSTLNNLIHIDSLDQDIKVDLIGLYRKLRGIDVIDLTYSCFSRVQLNSNNFFYDFLLKICELIYDNLLVSEDTGQSKFRDFIQDERRMAYLYFHTGSFLISDIKNISIDVVINR